MSSLMDAGVNFEIVDFPEATPLLIHLLVAIAEYEADHWKDREQRRMAGAAKGNERSAMVRSANANERLQFFRT